MEKARTFQQLNDNDSKVDSKEEIWEVFPNNLDSTEKTIVDMRIDGCSFKEAKKFQEQQEKIRGEALNRIQDPELKKLAEKFSDPSHVLAFADKITSREAPYSGKGASPQQEANRFAKRPNESITDWSMRIDREIASRK